MILGPHDHYVLALAALVGTFAASGAVLWLAFRSGWQGAVRGFRGIVPPFLNVVGVLFALNLAFLANDTWSAHDRARDSVFEEAGQLRALLVEAEHLPPALREPLRTTILAYARLEAEQEWPRLAARGSSAEAAEAIDRLLTLVTAPEIRAVLGDSLQGLLARQVEQVRSLRDLRVGLSRTHVNPLKWLGMAFLGFLTVVSIVVVHVELPKAALLATLIFAAASAPTAAIVLIQGNPFLEPMGVDPAPISGLR